ncbi:MAG: outer membrane protein insertion porin family [Saprospiraceae bacterium]|jgi:outer membrane protein insertion porin family
MKFILEIKNIFLFSALLLLLSSGTSCSLKKSVPKGSFRYNGAKVKVKTDVDSFSTKGLPANLTAALAPKPNRKILGIPFRLMQYNLGYSRKKQKSNFDEKGEAPVIYSDTKTKEVEKILESVAFNNGYFYSEVESKVKKRKWKRKAKVKYTVKVKTPYKITKLSYIVKEEKIRNLINSQQEKSLVKSGKLYRLDALRTERKRLASYMKSQGYYYFEDNMLEFTADTSYISNQIHLLLSVKPDTPNKALRSYKIGKIEIYPDYEISDARTNREKDTLHQEQIDFIYKELTVKAEVLRDAVTLIPGTQYDPKRHESTLKRLSNLNTFKYVSVRFEPSVADNSILDIRILLTPKNKRTIEAEMGISFRSALYVTPEATINYINRNLFGGSEQLQISATGAFNFPLNDTLSYSDRYRVLTKYEKPGLWSPFKNLDFAVNTIGNTKAELDIERQSYNLRFAGVANAVEEESPELALFLEQNSNFVPSFALTKAEISFGYNWRKKPHIRHELNPISFGYQKSNFDKQDDDINEFILILSLLSNTPQIAFSLEDMIYYQPEYIFNLDTRLQKYRRDNYLLRARFAFAGNTIVSRNSPILEPVFFQSQYFAIEPDFRYLAVYSTKSQFAIRFAPSITLPFNRDIILPFFDLYSIGGPSSNRGFVPRTVGPGSRPQDQPLEFPFTGIGNLKIEANAEYRFKVSSLVELATFIDAGNVWQVYQEDDIYETEFKFNRFYKQLAVSTGIGFRLDFEILLLRFDFGIPLFKPYLPEGERFVGDEIKLGDPIYRKENLQFNFAFGYPF